MSHPSNLASVLADLPLTEDSLALNFAGEYQERARFENHSGKWYVWNGKVWQKNETWVARDWARNLCRNWAVRSRADARDLGKSSTINGVEKLARVDQRLSVTSDIFDKDPYLLGTPGGTVDLRDGAIRPSDQGDYITKSTAVAPDEGEPELWLRFLLEANNGNQQMVSYLQEVAGYCLTGSIKEHALFFVFGPGGNGKSVFLNVLRRIMGDYAMSAPIDTFMASQFQRHSTDIAMMKGARLVTASETDSDRQWAEARIKQLTGGDEVTARFMRQDNFTFKPQFKLLIVGNHKPALRTVDEAAKRRFRMIPFTVRPPAPDPDLEDKLVDEFPRILQWMIDGCIQWQVEGLRPPEAVSKATSEYFDDQDTVQQWIDDCCETATDQFSAINMRCGSQKLYSSWKSWAEKNGEVSGTNKSFSQELARRGFEKKRGVMGMEFNGIRLKVQPQAT